MNFSYEAILEPLWDLSVEGTRLDLLSSVQRSILQTQMFEDAINGSGLSSVFYNNGGDFAYESLEALKKINSELTTKLLQDGIDLFPKDKIPNNIDLCREIMEDLPESIEGKWNNLSDMFYKREENLLELKMAYIISNSEHFELKDSGKNTLNHINESGDFNYFVCELDSNKDCVIYNGAFEPYAGVSFNLAMDLKLPTICLKLNTNKLTDIIPNYKGIFIINEKVRAILAKYESMNLQYVDLDIQLKSGETVSETYKALNVRNIIRAIDKDLSDIEWSELYEDEDEEDRYPTRIAKLVLKSKVIEKETIFKIDQFELPLFLRGDLVADLISEEITGVSFYKSKDFTF
ncbi:MAG: DUF4375 domain-containing protein [Crocinitomix sp.]|nr:DUF4375 domain-containing protein [Crocinitomix sp.]